MSGTQAGISITAGPEGAEDGLVKPTTRVLTLKEASQVFTKPALKNFQSPASSDPELIEHIDAHFIVSSRGFLNGLPAETINGFINFILSLKKSGGHVLRPKIVFKLEIALNARFALVVEESSHPDATHAKRLLSELAEM